MPVCSLCTGTHYLSDVPELGPCPACCTPEAMQRLDRTIDALTRPMSAIEVLDQLESAVVVIRDHIARVEAERDATFV